MSECDINTLTSDRLCPVHNKEICCELCFETVQVLDGLIKVSSVPELTTVDTKNAKIRCARCKYYSTWQEDF